MRMVQSHLKVRQETSVDEVQKDKWRGPDISPFKKNFFNVYSFLRERERETECEQWRGREETQNIKQAPGSELSAQSLTRGSNL